MCSFSYAVSNVVSEAHLVDAPDAQRNLEDMPTALELSDSSND